MIRSPFWRVAGRELWTSGRLLLLLCIAVALVAYLMGASFPAFKERMMAAGQHAPRFVKKLIESRAGGLTVESFVAIAFIHPVVFAMMSAWPINRAARAVGGEIERGAMGWMLAYPIGRLRFLGARALVMLAGTALIPLALSAGFLVTFQILGIPNAGPRPYLWTALWSFLLYGAVGTLTLWVSAASSRASTPAFVGAGLVVGSFMLEFLGEAYEPLKPYRVLSLYHYFRYQSLMSGEAPYWPDAAVLGGLLVLGLVGALWTFRRRDLSI